MGLAALLVTIHMCDDAVVLTTNSASQYGEYSRLDDLASRTTKPLSAFPDNKRTVHFPTSSSRPIHLHRATFREASTFISS